MWMKTRGIKWSSRVKKKKDEKLEKLDHDRFVKKKKKRKSTSPNNKK